jgi:HEPN domain-containing protein
MTPFIEEACRMVRLAERDYQTFSILRSHPDAPLATTCFHAQQCVEKALKAVLMAHQANFRRTHDLEEISGLLKKAQLIAPFTEEQYSGLSPFAVEFRYDELTMPVLTMEEVDQIAFRTLEWAREQVSEKSSL